MRYICRYCKIAHRTPEERDRRERYCELAIRLTSETPAWLTALAGRPA